MKSPMSPSGDRLLQDPQDFSLVLGGPLFQLMRRAHLTGDALMLMRQRILVLSLFAWLPLLVLSALEGAGVSVTSKLTVSILKSLPGESFRAESASDRPASSKGQVWLQL